MDFNDTPEEAAFRAEVHAWLAANAKPRKTADAGILAREDEGLVKKAKQWQAKKADAGWACITWPKKYGGRGASSIQGVVFGQEEGKFDVPASIFGIGIGMAGPTIMVHGSEQQKERYLPPMLRGEEIWCQLFSEPGAGSDLAGLKTRAEKKGDMWVVNGQKVWTSGAHYSDWGILVARSDFDATKHKGLTYFIVDMKSPGIEIRPIKQITGGANFNEVFFADVQIPDSNRLNAVGAGWSVALTTLMNERFSIGGGGGGGPGFDALLGLALGTPYNGGTAMDDAAVRQRIANFYILSRGLKYIGFRSLTALSKGATPGPEASIGKLVMTQLMAEMSAFALELQGSAGLLSDKEFLPDDAAAWQGMFLAAPAMRIAGGSDEILKNIVGERVLGLPGDVRADKGIPFKDIPTGGE